MPEPGLPGPIAHLYGLEVVPNADRSFSGVFVTRERGKGGVRVKWRGIFSETLGNCREPSGMGNEAFSQD
jgi:hypothetical protein